MSPSPKVSGVETLAALIPKGRPTSGTDDFSTSALEVERSICRSATDGLGLTADFGSDSIVTVSVASE